MAEQTEPRSAVTEVRKLLNRKAQERSGEAIILLAERLDQLTAEIAELKSQVGRPPMYSGPKISR